MSNSEAAHCRLCADLKPYSTLVNLQTDNDRRGNVVEKLVRLSLQVNLHSSEDGLSKTVCFSCMDSLDMAFDFVKKVEASQSKLNTIITENIKQEVIDNEQIYDVEENYDIIVKEESDSDTSDLEVTNRQRSIKNENNSKIQHESLSFNTSNLEVTNRPLNDNNSKIQHESLSWKDYSWRCAYCDTMFPNIHKLKQHSMECHGRCNPYECTDCNLRTRNLDKFLKHVKRHRQHLKLSCYICHKTLPKQRDMIRHKKEHLATNFCCPGCNETFPTLEESIEHRNLYNKKIPDKPIEAIKYITDDFTCVFCSKKFKKKRGLTHHLLIHTERKRDHTCEQCGKCFLSKKNLADHMISHDGTRPHQCEICKQRFSKLPTLRKHLSIHEGKKPFSCDQCGRLFRLRSQLNSHIIIHTDSLPFVCSYCQKSFRFKTLLTLHVHQHTGLKPYKCEICHHDFIYWSNYNRHMMKWHDMNMAKRKRTPGGMLPINPDTGDVDLQPETKKTAEWKKKILDNSNRPGRPKEIRKIIKIKK